MFVCVYMGIGVLLLLVFFLMWFFNVVVYVFVVLVHICTKWFGQMVMKSAWAKKFHELLILNFVWSCSILVSPNFLIDEPIRMDERTLFVREEMLFLQKLLPIPNHNFLDLVSNSFCLSSELKTRLITTRHI